MFYRNFVPKDLIFDFKNAVTLKTGLGSVKAVGNVTMRYSSIVTVALSRVVSGIFNAEICRDLEIGVKDHSRSLKVVPFDRLCMVSY